MDHLADDLERALIEAPSRVLDRDDVPAALLVQPTVRGLLLLAMVDWLVIGACWTSMAVLPWWSWPLFMVIIASRIHALGVVLHDAAHMPLRHKSASVRLLEVMCGYPLATTVNAMRYHHLRHHRDSGMPSDPYFKAGVGDSNLLYSANVLRGLLLMPFWTVRPWFGVAATLLPGLRPTYAKVFLQDRSGGDLRHSTEVRVCAREEALQAVFQLPILVALVFAPLPVIVGYAAPAVIAGVLAAWRLLQEHRYEAADDRRIETIFATTCDHHLAWYNRWLLAPHNIGYHVVHHIHPQVSLAALPALRTWYLAHQPTYPEPR